MSLKSLFLCFYEGKRWGGKFSNRDVSISSRTGVDCTVSHHCPREEAIFKAGGKCHVEDHCPRPPRSQALPQLSWESTPLALFTPPGRRWSQATVLQLPSLASLNLISWELSRNTHKIIKEVLSSFFPHPKGHFIVYTIYQLQNSLLFNRDTCFHFK